MFSIQSLHDQSLEPLTHRLQDLLFKELFPVAQNQTVGGNMRRKLAPFDDPELKSWLLESIAEPSPSFLSALAEAVLTANPEDYAVVRPCLIRLREKYRREAKKTRIHREKPIQHNTPIAVPDQSRARLRNMAADLTD